MHRRSLCFTSTLVFKPFRPQPLTVPRRRFGTQPLSSSGFRFAVQASPLASRLADGQGRNGFVILRTGLSPPVALHPASRRRSYIRLQAGECLPEEDLHLSERVRSQAHKPRAAPWVRGSPLYPVRPEGPRYRARMRRSVVAPPWGAGVAPTSIPRAMPWVAEKSRAFSPARRADGKRVAPGKDGRTGKDREERTAKNCPSFGRGPLPSEIFSTNFKGEAPPPNLPKISQRGDVPFQNLPVDLGGRLSPVSLVKKISPGECRPLKFARGESIGCGWVERHVTHSQIRVDSAS